MVVIPFARTNMLRNGDFLNGKYRIEKILGEGGMGTVYLGSDLVVERYVAVKEIKHSLPDYDKYIERIKKEAKALARLNHPNIVILYELLQYQDNLYIVMEYVDGVTLDKKLEQAKALPYQEAIPIFKQILAALDHAHQAGVIHRDIKPGNVMLKSDGQVKVMDFGLAKTQTSPTATRATQSEDTGGTLYYLSPEQVKSDGKMVDHRSDIYALGMTCYEVLTAYLPLKKKTTTVEILNAILRDNFPPPTKFNATVPTELGKIVRQAIALKPEKRFQSAREMLAEVEKFEAAFTHNNGRLAPRRRRISLTLEIAWSIITVALVVALITIFAVPDLPLRILRWTGIRSSTKVAIHTEPVGAQIKLGGKAIGKSPLSRLVDVDTLRVAIEESTYFTIDSSIVVKGKTDTTLVFVLEPAATVALAAVPKSAEVMIDGKTIPPADRGHIELAVGEHDLRITSEGYETIDKKIFLRHGFNQPRSDTLKQTRTTALWPPPASQTKRASQARPKDTVTVVAAETTAVATPVQTGILTLAINPPSEVYIDDSLAATAATQPSFSLPLNKHAIAVVHATLGKWLEDISMTERGAVREIDFAKKYTLRVLAVDSTTGEWISAAIYLDDRATGKVTPDKLLLNFGYHAIEARLEGFAPKRREFNVEKNGKLEFMLKRAR